MHLVAEAAPDVRAVFGTTNGHHPIAGFRPSNALGINLDSDRVSRCRTGTLDDAGLADPAAKRSPRNQFVDSERER